MNNTEKSSIKLTSNIILKSKFEKDNQGYLPFDLLPDYYRDVRLQSHISKPQQLQNLKRLFFAETIIDVTDDG